MMLLLVPLRSISVKTKLTTTKTEASWKRRDIFLPLTWGQQAVVQ